MRTKHWVRSAPLSVLALLVLGACSSSSDKSLDSQAIDGYIVKGLVSCDGVDADVTGLAGRLTCPKSTELVTVSGGWDVGFDDTAETSDIVFAGKLRAPAGLGYVTPLSTVAVQMASTEGVYQSDLWAEKVESLGKALGDSTLNLSMDPSDLVNSKDLIRFNMQIHQVLSAIAKSQGGYETAVAAFATVMTKTAASGGTADLESNVAATLEAVNAELLTSGSDLYLLPADLAALAVTVATTNQAITAAVAAGNPDQVTAAAVVAQASLTIDRSAQSVVLTGSGGVETAISIDDFENSTLSGGSYQTQVGAGLVEVGYNNDVLQFDKDLVNVQVTMGFELKSTDAGDNRGLSFYSHDISLSATKNDSDSLVISLADGATLHAVGMDSMGTKTTAEVLVGADRTFSNTSGQFSVNYDSIVDKLESLGFENIFAGTEGNYEMTLIIGGLQIKEGSGSDVVPATGYDISVGDQLVSGAGFKGYISYLD